MRNIFVSLLCLILLQAWQAQAVTAPSQQKNPKSCIDTTITGVYNLTLSNNFTFEVLCNSDITDPGWTVIQQRIRGGVDFYQNWTTYRNGFGDFWEGDFFLGLEKIHRLTNEQPHKLYIYMKRFDGSALIARYDEFAISGESDGYRITKLGKFGGHTLDRLKMHKDVRFSTYDRDNDEWNMNCAKTYHNAWWNKFCYNW